MGMKSLIGALAFVAVTTLACSDSSGPDVDDFDTNRALWASHQIDSYEYSLARICFCHPEFVGPARIRVTNNAVDSVWVLSTGEAVPDSLVSRFWNVTVDSLFRSLEQIRAMRPDSLHVEYDRTRGYPRRIVVDYLRGAADDEIAYHAELLE